LIYELFKTKIEIQFVDGDKKDFEFEEDGKDQLDYKHLEEGIEIMKNKLEPGDTYNFPQYEERLFFPYFNIKYVKFSYKYK
jgi:hypothetical protein